LSAGAWVSVERGALLTGVARAQILGHEDPDGGDPHDQIHDHRDDVVLGRLGGVGRAGAGLRGGAVLPASVASQYFLMGTDVT
jgi:hypothetical protein